MKLPTYLLFLLAAVLISSGCRTTSSTAPDVSTSSEVDAAVSERMQDIADTASTARTVPEVPEPVKTGLERIERVSGKVGSPDMNKLDSSRLKEAQSLLEKSKTAEIRREQIHAEKIALMEMEHAEALKKAKGERADRLSIVFTRIAAGMSTLGIVAIGLGLWSGRPRIITGGVCAFVGGLLMGASALVLDHPAMPYIVFAFIIAGAWVVFKEIREADPRESLICRKEKTHGTAGLKVKD